VLLVTSNKSFSIEYDYPQIQTNVYRKLFNVVYNLLSMNAEINDLVD
jgi:hypothetical protein